ncbi:MAG: hypothetical protein QXS81_01420 [Candidatus Micrarchaeaceae archaeon]
MTNLRKLVCPHCGMKGTLHPFKGLGHEKYGYEEVRCAHCGMVMPREEAEEKQKLYA